VRRIVVPAALAIVVLVAFGWARSSGFVSPRLARAQPGPAAAQSSPPQSGTAPSSATSTPVVGSDRLGVTYGATELDPRAGPALDSASQAGVGWVRIIFYWGRLEPSPGTWDFSQFDALVQRASADNVKVLGTLAFATTWNTTAPLYELRPANREHYPPSDYGAWENYVQTVVARYHDSVPAWEVWNEEDLHTFWGGTPAQFAHLQASAYGAAKQADPNALVLLGGLSLGGSPGNLDPNFLDEVLSDPTYATEQYLDGIAFHHYGAQDEARKRFNYVQGALDKANGNGKPIWVTEVGYGSDPALQRDPAYQGQEGQAAWLKMMLPYLLDLGVERVFWYTLFDTPNGGPPFASHGLLDGDLNPKQALAAMWSLATGGS
jgi:hypothetical protein